MKVLVYPHAMEIGGSQLNAVELAVAVRDLGHQVVVTSEPGPLVDRVIEAGIEHVRLDPGRRRPSAATARRLRGLVADRGIDIVHGYEWPPGIEAYFAARPRRATAAVCTVMSMSVAPFLPYGLPLVVGTEDIRRSVLERRADPDQVHLIEPPVDLTANAPGFPVEDFRERFGLGEGSIDVVVVCRLVPELKLEGILTAIDVVGTLAAELPLRLVIVGDGPARPLVQSRAEAANERAGRRVVVLTGQLDDPRPAYAAASIALGMGGSALRALAFARPLVVQGEDGFFELLTPESSETFLRQGWYGLGGDGGPRLAAILRELAGDQARREELGDYGRGLVAERFGLERAARALESIYLDALDRAATGARASRLAGRTEAARTATGVAAYKVRRRYQRLRGDAARDDFNAVPPRAPGTRP